LIDRAAHNTDGASADTIDFCSSRFEVSAPILDRIQQEGYFVKIRTTTHNHPGEPGVILLDQPLADMIVATDIRDGATTLFGTVDLQVNYSGKYDIRVELSPDELTRAYRLLVKNLLEKIQELTSEQSP
jgi:hypothetical protein